MTQPTIGRTVHFKLAAGEVRPATIVRVWPDEFGPGTIGLNLQVQVDGANDESHVAELLERVVNSPRWAADRAREICTRGLWWVTSVPQGDGVGQWSWPVRG